MTTENLKSELQALIFESDDFAKNIRHISNRFDPNKGGYTEDIHNDLKESYEKFMDAMFSLETIKKKLTEKNIRL